MGLRTPLALSPSYQGLFLALGWGWCPPELGHSLPLSQEPVGSIRPFWHSFPTRPAPQDASLREGPTGSMPAWPLLAVAWHLSVVVCVCMYGESLPLDTWVWVPCFELESESCKLALNHPGIRLQLDWDECFGEIWKTLGTRPTFFHPRVGAQPWGPALQSPCTFPGRGCKLQGCLALFWLSLQL